ncbi:MAG TPA: DUF3426 domain-containing protein [Ramlibacter sp.]
MPALITRCPACATMFKVVPDQLRVSEGWVRCGHCSEVFDASAHLQPPAAAAQEQEQEQEQEARAGAGAQRPPSGAPEANPFDADARPPGAAAVHDHTAADEAPPDAAPDSEPTSDSSPDSVASSPLTEIDEELPDDEPDPLRLQAEQRALQEDPLDRPFSLRREDLSAPAELTPSELPGVGAPLEQLTFVRQARREARWQRPAVRGLLSVLALALAGLLGLQIAVQERDRLAAAEPALRPWLARVCDALGCRVAPPRRIEAIAIDGSTFNRLRPDAYRLEVTLKNQSAGQVALPAVELTLTDSEEQPVVRRVLMPGELGAARLALGARSEWSGTAAFALQDASLASRVAGYRVLAFYP